MLSKRHSPTFENTAERLRAEGPIRYKRRHIQAIEASSQSTRKKLCERLAGAVGRKVASTVGGRW